MRRVRTSSPAARRWPPAPGRSRSCSPTISPHSRSCSSTSSATYRNSSSRSRTARCSTADARCEAHALGALTIAVALVEAGLMAEARARLAGLDLDHVRPSRSRARIEPIAPGRRREHRRRLGHRFSTRPGRGPGGRWRVILLREEVATGDIAGSSPPSGSWPRAAGARRTRRSSRASSASPASSAARPSDRRRRARLRHRRMRLQEGDDVTLDGDNGRILDAGTLPLVHERPEAELAELARWRRGRP